MPEHKSQIEQFLADYEKAGGQDPLVWRVALPHLDLAPQRKRGPKPRTMGDELHQWYLVEKARRALQGSATRATDVAACGRAGIATRTFQRAKENSLVLALLKMRQALLEAHVATGRSPLSAESFWWDQVEAIHADWQVMRAAQHLKQGNI